MSVVKTVRNGSFFAEIAILGLGGHSSVPFRTHNPVIAGFELIHTVNTRVWFEFDSFDNVTLYPVSFNAGTKENIIPEEAELKYYGAFADEVQEQHLKDVLVSSLEAIKNLYKVDYRISYEGGK